MGPTVAMKALQEPREGDRTGSGEVKTGLSKPVMDKIQYMNMRTYLLLWNIFTYEYNVISMG